MQIGRYIRESLLKQLGILFSDKSTFTRIQNIVSRVDENQIASGQSKRQFAIDEIKDVGIKVGGYILNLLIEIAVALIREKNSKNINDK